MNNVAEVVKDLVFVAILILLLVLLVELCDLLAESRIRLPVVVVMIDYWTFKLQLGLFFSELGQLLFY